MTLPQEQSLLVVAPFLRRRHGGANGSICYQPEIGHAANAGLVGGLKILQPIKDKHPEVGWADLIQLASATAVEAAGEHGEIDVALLIDRGRTFF